MSAGTVGPTILPPRPSQAIWWRGASTPPPQPRPRGGAGKDPGVDLTLLAPQPSDPSLLREVLQPPKTKTRTWNGPQRLMHFQGPILQMGTQRGREGSAACLGSQAVTWRISFSQKHSWNSEVRLLCSSAPERETWLVLLFISLKTISEAKLSREHRHQCSGRS